MRINLDGLNAEEIRRVQALVTTAGPRERVSLRLAARMAGDGEKSGARWIVVQLLERRERNGAPD